MDTTAREMDQLPQIHKCLICQKELASKASLRCHTRRVHSDTLKPKVCNLCPTSYHTKRELNVHIIRRHIKIYPFDCPHCPKTFVSASQLKSHLSGQTEVGLRECPECGKKFTTPAGLRAHTLMHSFVKPHICAVCNRGFTKKSRLTDHMAVHSDDKPFKCDSCPMAFSIKTRLTRHSNVHAERDPFVCSDCGNEYKSKKGLGTHRIAKHGAVSKFICPVCGVTAVDSSTLDEHVRRHTGERPFKCGECDKSYPSASALRTHSKFHKGRTQKCTLCEYAAVEKVTLTRHMRSVHSDDRPLC